MDCLKSDLHIMPPENTVAMPPQDFGAPFQDAGAPGAGPDERSGLWRFLAFSPAMVATFGLLWVMIGWFADMGLRSEERRVGKEW